MTTVHRGHFRWTKVTNCSPTRTECRVACNVKTNLCALPACGHQAPASASKRTMQSTFYGYYPPTDLQYGLLWKEATIVLDTNVLLNLYRLPTTARDEFISALENLKSRLWIPHQVALEFQRRRLTVIASERKNTEEAVNAAKKLAGELKAKIEALQIDKRDIGIDVKPLIEGFENANSKLVDALDVAHARQFEISASDALRDSLDKLFEGKVGDGPKDQNELDSLSSNGDERYANKIPPGFADIDKEKNPTEAYFFHDHLKYERKFGDLILWRQILSHAKINSIKYLIFVTADRKDDWWWREQGRTIGAHPELLREMKREGEVELFWMYSPAQFLEHANKFTTIEVSSQSVDEVKQVAADDLKIIQSNELKVSPSLLDRAASHRERAIQASKRRRLRVMSYVEMIEDGAQDAVFNWLIGEYQDLEIKPQGNSDFVAETRRGGLHGFRFDVYASIDALVTLSTGEYIADAILDADIKGYSFFTYIAVLTEREFLNITGVTLQKLTKHFQNIVPDYPSHNMVIGFSTGSEFSPILKIDPLTS